MTETAEFKYDVFISYSHQDEEWVRGTLLPVLETQGWNYCIDFRDFTAGNPRIVNIQNATESSRHTLLILTPQWLESESNLYESLLTFTDDPAGLKRRTIPILLEPCKPPKFIAMLSPVNFIDKRRESEAWQNLFKAIFESENTQDAETSEQKQLAKAIATYMGNIKSQVELAQKSFDSKSPYKGLLEYDIRDIPFFFGRETAIGEMLEAVDRNPLTVFHAESGAGKTSLLKAGIRPKLFADKHLPLYILPRQDPVDISIKRALLQQLQESPIWMNTTLHDFTQEVSRLLGGKWLIIIIDQFEEIFTLQSQEAREQFVKQLAQCLDDDLLPVRWILSIRAESLSKLAKFRSHISNPTENLVFLESLKREEAGLAIRKPAEIKGVNYDSELVDTILDELGPQEIPPPELQIVCSALYEARGNNKTISRELYETLGGTKGILHGHFDRVLNQKISPDQKQLAQQVLVALVDDDGSMISLSSNELDSRLKKQKTDTVHLADVLDQLAAGHLLREEPNSADQAIMTYELAHDYLKDKLELTPTLQKRKIAQKLIEQKIPHYRRDGLLLSPDELALIIPQENYLSLDDDALELLQKSRRNVQQRQLRNGISSIAVNMFMVVAVLFLTGKLSTTFNLVYIFWLYVIAFAVIGGIRGWSKELLVSFSVLLALALNHVIRRYIPIAAALPETDVYIFWVRTLVLIILVFVGYQTVITIPHLAAPAHERLHDTYLGAILGALNGYLIAGTILFYMHVANYPFQDFISRPQDPALLQTVNQLMLYMPPQLLGEPGIYFAVIISFVFLIIVYSGDQAFLAITNTLKRIRSKAGAKSSSV